MIISVSKRTDIPALYGDWFMKRLEEGFAYSINPYNPKQVKKVSLLKEDVDAFVFWTKNPIPFMKHIPKLKDYVYYVQFTLTPYGRDLEENLPKKDLLVDAFQDLSKKIGKNSVIWRYDPVVLVNDYTSQWHIKMFEDYASRLSPYTNRVVISFVDQYKKHAHTFEELGIGELSDQEMHVLADKLARIARKYDLEIETCAEAIDLSAYGIRHIKCIDNDLISKLSGKEVIYERDPYQRASCHCHKSIDIGSYDTCILGCRYCYAVGNKSKALRSYKAHQLTDSNLLRVEIDEEIKVTKKAPTLFD